MADKIFDAIMVGVDSKTVVIDGISYVPAYVARDMARASADLAHQLLTVEERSVDQSWDLENYRQQQRDNWVPDGAWS